MNREVFDHPVDPKCRRDMTEKFIVMFHRNTLLSFFIVCNTDLAI